MDARMDARMNARTDASTPGRAGPRPYDPAYDPLVSPPGQGQDYAPTYWVATAGSPPQDDGPVNGDMEVDVAVVGSGFTGLSAALTLARDYGVRAVVLEANRAVWGCTSRNGGQGQNASGRLYRSQWIQRWGLDTARRLDAEIREGFEYWKSLVAQVDCDAQPGGHLYTAHRQKKMAFLENESRVMREVFGYDTRMLSRTSCASATWTTTRPWARCWSRTAWACIRSLAYGYLRQRARWARASIRPARCWLARAERRLPVADPGGTRAARGFATGGYTAQGVNPLLDNRIMPVLSNSLVTRALSPAELEAAGLKAPSSSPTRARCAFTTGCCRTAACRSAAAARSMAPTRRTRATWPCSRPGWAQSRCATWTWIIPGGAGWTSATT